MGTRQKWLGMIVILATLLLGSAAPGYAWRGGHGGGGHGGGWHRGHGWGGPRVGIGIGIGPYWGPYWGSYTYPFAYPYGYPPVVAVPSIQVYVQPSAPAAASLLQRPLGIIVTIHRGIIPTSSNVLGDGGR